MSNLIEFNLMLAREVWQGGEAELGDVRGVREYEVSGQLYMGP